MSSDRNSDAPTIEEWTSDDENVEVKEKSNVVKVEVKHAPKVVKTENIKPVRKSV